MTSSICKCISIGDEDHINWPDTYIAISRCPYSPYRHGNRLINTSGTVRSEDFRGQRKLQEITGECFACGVVLYDSEASVRFGLRLFALPVQTLWTE